MRTNMIWKSLLMSAVLLVSGAMISCDKDEDPTDFNAQISTSISSKSVDPGEEVNFTVTSNTKWTAAIDDPNGILTLSKSAGGSGETAVKATISSNAAEGNKATVTFTAMGYAFGYEIPVSQKVVFGVGSLTPATGSGTLEDPFTAAGANAKAKELGSGETSAESYFIKGVVTSVKEAYTTQYGNGTFYIGDSASASETFYVYRAYYLDNKKYSNESDPNIEVGDEVVIYGKICNYNGTLETAQNGAYLYSLNGVGGSGEVPETPGDDDENVIGKIANLKAGDYYMSAYISGNYYLWSGTATTSGTSTYLSTSQYTYNAETATLSPVANNNAVKMTLEAVSGKSNTYYIMYGGKYVYTTGSSNHNLGFGDTKAEWVFTDNSSGGVVATSGGLTLGTSTQAQSNQLRALANAANVGGMYFFNADVTIDGDGGGNQGGETGDIEHAGTLEDPYTVADAIAKCQEIGDTQSADSYYIKGVIKSLVDNFGNNTYGNGTFYIKDANADNEFYAYRIYYLDNKQWVTGNSIPAIGDEVVIYGKITNYKGNTPETVQGSAYLYSLNGKTTEDGGNQGGGNEGDGDEIAAGEYFMFGVVNGTYYAWDGKDPYSGQLQTRAYNYNESTKTFTIVGADNYAGVAGKITLEDAGSGKYYIKSGSKYLYSTEAANHKLTLGDDKSLAEWTFTEHSAGGYIGHNNGINLGTNGGASSRFIRGMVNESNLTYGIELLLTSSVTVNNGEYGESSGGDNTGGGNTGGGDDGGNSAYTQITSVSDITDGQYVIAANISGTYYTLPTTIADRPNGVAWNPENTTTNIWTIKKEGDVYTLSNGTNYLTYTGSSTTWKAGTSASDNTAQFVITYDSANSSFKLVVKSTESASTVRGLLFQSNSTYQRFGAYAMSQFHNGEYYGIQLFKVQ